ncbi:hypothetical protein ACJ41O_000017 [Fusarium nematophilum]
MSVKAHDPTYVEDFWTRSGYLGSDPEDPIQAHRVQFETTIASITLGDAALQVKFIDSPERVLEDSNIVVIDGTSKGALIPTTRIQNGTATFPWITTQADLASLRPGDKYYGWNQFRDKQGKPLYPRRNVSIGRLGTLNSASCIQDGHITAPTLHLQNLMDIDAFPWKADWYKPAVKRALGSEANDQFVLWYTDHAQHDNPASMLAHAYTINFSGVLQQGLRDPAGCMSQILQKPAVGSSLSFASEQTEEIALW